MALWGKFESVKELAQSGVGLLWTARPSGDAASNGGERYIIKTTEQLAMLGDVDRLERESALFLEAAAIQKSLADGGATHWAKIVELGNTDQGAFYVAELYARSVQILVTRGVRLDGHGIRHIVLSILSGLAEIREKAGRAHGNLKSSNVLVGGPDGPTVNNDRVVLTDPLPTRSLSKQSLAEDLRHLGELVFELVTLRSPKSGVGMTVSLTEDWSRLGSSATAWVDFCNRLMDASPGKPVPDLEEVRAMVPAGAAIAVKRSKAPLIAAAAVLLLAAGGVTAWKFASPSGPQPIVVTEQDIKDADAVWPKVQHAQVWLAHREKLANQLGKFDPAMIASMPEPLRSRKVIVVDDVKRVGDRMLPSNWFDPEKPQAGQEDANRKIDAVRQASAELAEFRQSLEQFAPVEQSMARAKAWEDRGWTAQAECLLRALRDMNRLRGEGDRVSADTEVGGLGISLGIVAYSVEIEARYKPLLDAASGLAGAGDEAGKSFLPIVNSSVGKPKGADKLAMREVDTIKVAFGEMLASLDGFRALAAEVGAATDAAKVDLPFVRESGAYKAVLSKSKAGTPVSLDEVKAWIAEAKKPEYAIRERDDLVTWSVAPLAAIEERRGFLALRVEAKVTTEADAATLTKELAAAAAKINELRAITKLSDRGLASLSDRMEAAKASVTELAAKILPPGKYRKAVDLAKGAAESSVPPMFVEGWRAKVAQIMQGQSDDLAKLYRLEQLLVGDKVGWASALNQAEGRFVIPASPEPAIASAPAFQAAIKARRDAALMTYAAKLRPASTGDAVDLADADVVVREYGEFLASLETAKVELAASLADYQKGLGESDKAVGARLAKVRRPSPGVDGSAIFAPGLAPFDRLRSLQDDVASGKLGLDDLLKRVGEGTDLAMKLASWEGVSSVKDWSGKTGQLTGLSAAATSLSRAVDASPASAGERERMKAAVADSQRKAWVGVMNWASTAAGSDESVDQALAAAASLGVRTEQDATGLSSASRFNWTLKLARESLPKAKVSATGEAALASEVKKVSDRLGVLAAEGKLPEAKADPIRKLLRKFEAASTEIAPKMFDKDTAGPLSDVPGISRGAGWTVSEPVEERVIVYSFTGPSGRHDLRFEMVDENSGAMVMVNEVSVGLFVDVLASSNQLPEVIPGLRDQSDTELFGPAAWVYAGKAISGASPPSGRSPAEGWLGFFEDTQSAFANKVPASGPGGWPSVSGPPPSLQMPMTWVSPAAAAYFAATLGCRLPTVSEWQAANSRGATGRNRRDDDWASFVKGAASMHEGLGGDGGAGFRVRDVMPHGSTLGLLDPANPQVDTTPAVSGSDGFVFFAPVEPAGNGFTDLVGNVWEYTFDNASVWPCATGAPVDSPAAFRRNPAFSASNFRAIGGSAMSGPKLDPASAIAVPDIGGFSDVGIRLVFVRGEGSSKKSVGDRLDKAVAVKPDEPKYWRP